MKPLVARLTSSHLPEIQGELIWIHAVSVGEVKAAEPLFRALKQSFPQAFFFVTTTTTTGQEEVKRSLEADAIRYLPFDLPWVVRSWVRRLQPKLFLLVETDFWPNLLRALRKAGCRTVLVSGKLSARSARRFHRFSFFSKKLFSYLDLLCVQNEEHAARFAPLIDPARLQITGNLKLDRQPQPVDLTPWQGIFSQPAIAITCTHPGEEEPILDALVDLDFCLFLAPRHPERFEEVAQLLQRKKIAFSRWSQPEPAKVVLIDAMGQLPICYRLSRLAIVGGSFTGLVGGHNILEPCLYEIPVFFGPSMYSQEEFAKRVLDAGAGKQLSFETLRHSVQNFFEEEPLLRRGVQTLFEQGRGATERTLEQIRRQTTGDLEPQK